MRRVRLSPDYGHTYSLWEAEAGGAVDPDKYGLSKELSLALEVWTADWNQNHDPFKGWVSSEAERVHNAVGYVVGQWLKSELGPEFTVELPEEMIWA